MISVQQIQYIIALSEEKHFLKASERCFVTQPTLSMQIKKAEEIVGNLIFDRSRTPVELTPFGETLLPILREIQREFDNIELLKKKSEGVYIERLHVGIIPTIAGYMLPDLYSRWRAELTGVELVLSELKTEEVIEALDQRKLDLGIIAGPFHSEKMRTTPLYREEIMAYFPGSNKDAVSTEELAAEDPWLLTRGNCLRNQMVNFCKISVETEGWNYSGGNLGVLTKMVDLNGGYTLVPAHYANEFGSGLKHILSSQQEVPIREVIAVSPNRSIKWDAVERFIRSIQLAYPEKFHSQKTQVLNWK